MAEKKHVHIATIGSDDSYIYKVIRFVPQIDDIYLLYTMDNPVDPEYFKKIAENIQGVLLHTYEKVELVCVGLEDFLGIVQTVYDIAKEYDPRTRFSINITGGTKLMSAAVYYSAYYIRAETWYSQFIPDADGNPVEKFTKVIKIDSPVAVNTSHYKPIKKEVLKYIAEWEEDKRAGKISASEDLTKNAIAFHFNRTRQSMLHHLDSLEKDGLLDVEKKKGHDSVRLSPHGVMIVRNLEADDNE